MIFKTSAERRVFFYACLLLIGLYKIGTPYKSTDIFKPYVTAHFYLPAFHVAIGSGKIVAF